MDYLYPSATQTILMTRVYQATEAFTTRCSSIAIQLRTLDLLVRATIFLSTLPRFMLIVLIVCISRPSMKLEIAMIFTPWSVIAPIFLALAIQYRGKISEYLLVELPVSRL